MSRTTIKRFIGAYHFLSNFHPAPVAVATGTFPTAEHAYQSFKCTNGDDVKLIRACRTPQQAKRLGRKIQLSPHWDRRKLGYMRQVLVAKFKDLELRRKLLATGDAKLIEGNWWHDTYWGVCEGVGENWLGLLLMEIREEIKQEMDK